MPSHYCGIYVGGGPGTGSARPFPFPHSLDSATFDSWELCLKWRLEL